MNLKPKINGLKLGCEVIMEICDFWLSLIISLPLDERERSNVTAGNRNDHLLPFAITCSNFFFTIAMTGFLSAKFFFLHYFSFCLFTLWSLSSVYSPVVCANPTQICLIMAGFDPLDIRSEMVVSGVGQMEKTPPTSPLIPKIDYTHCGGTFAHRDDRTTRSSKRDRCGESNWTFRN